VDEAGSWRLNRPEVRKNAFRPHTVDELYLGARHARSQRRRDGAAHGRPLAEGRRLGLLLRRRTARQRPRPATGTRTANGTEHSTLGGDTKRRLHIMEGTGDRLMPRWSSSRARLPRAVAQPPRRVRSSTWPAARHARFKQTDADVADFDGGSGSDLPGPQVGQKFAREIFFVGGYRRAAAHGGHGQCGGAAADLERNRAGVGRQDPKVRAPPRSGC